MGMRSLSAALEPKTVALVGASDKDGSLGATLLENLSDGFSGALDLVNPSGRVMRGRRSVATPADLPDAPDLALVAVPPKAVPGTLSALSARGCRAAAVITDMSRDGPVDRAALRAAAGRMRVIGPNSLGVANPWVGLQASIARLRPEPGGLAFVGQSATAAGPVVDWAGARGIGFSHIVSLGEMVDVDYADVLDFLAAAPRANGVILYLEAVADARRLLSAARAIARIKPVIVMKSAALSEAPARDAVFDAAFMRAGMLRVRTLDDLFDATEAFLARMPADARPDALGDRLAILANGQSVAALAAESARGAEVRLADLDGDAAERLRAVVPGDGVGGNPIDILADADADRYRAALEILMEAHDIDAVLVLNGPTGGSSGRAVAQCVAETVQARRLKPGRRKPWVFTSFPGGAHDEEAGEIFDAAHVPHFHTPSEAVRAYGQLVRHRRTAIALMQTPPSRPEAFDVDAKAARAAIEQALTGPDKTMDEAQIRAVLAAYNIAYEPEADLNHGAALLRVNATIDPDFGPVLRVKLGDHAGRKIDPGVAALPPLNLTLAELAVTQGLCGRLLHHADGGRAAAALLLAQASQLVSDQANVDGFEFDPVVVRDGRAVVTSARFRLSADPAEAACDRLAIRPYPQELERTITDRKGDAYKFRPIRPEDEPALVRLIGRLDPEDLRLRFFQPISTVSHEFAARLTQIDYDREMALILTEPDAAPGSGEIYGVARLIREQDGARAEYAVTVDSALQGRGLGRFLMEALIEYARADGIAEVFGLVLSENGSMLALNRRLGFVCAMDPDDPGVMRVTLALDAAAETPQTA